jgi:NAD+ kinase
MSMKLQRFAIVGDNHEKVKDLFLSKGYEEDSLHPEFVISYGGDGTLFRSEEAYPSIPKLFIKNTKIGKLAQKKANEEILEKFFEGKIIIKMIKKIEALINGKDHLYGAAEVSIHNADPRSAIRYTVRIDDNEIHHELIGDGVVVCNALGSTGYYKSITDSFFELGIGIAFNNSTEQADHMVLSNARRIAITLTRGPGIVFADNQKESFALDAGDQVELFESDQIFRYIEVM